MNRMPIYVSRLFLFQNLSISFAMIAVLSVLDALSKGDLLPPDAGLGAHLWFMVLRAPLLYDQVLAFAFLLSLLVTYVLLIRRNELVAMAAAGMSAAHQILTLAPAVILASLLSLLIIDQAAPRAQDTLISWLGAEAVSKNADFTDDLWLSDGNVLVRIDDVEDDMLTGVMFVERSDRGRVRAVSFAESARAEGDGFLLQDVTQTRFDDAPIDPPEFWTTGQTSQTLQLLLQQPRYLAAADLWRLSQLRGSGNRASSEYLVWLYGRMALPLMAMGFLIITVLVMQKFGRHPKAELTMVYVMGGGFVYVVIDNISKTLPENTTVQPSVAALAPVAGLLVVGGLLALRHIIRR